MLVLSRKTEESIVVDGNVTITILKVNGGRVRIGVEAPENVRILRGELVENDKYPHRVLTLEREPAASAWRAADG